MKRCHSSRAPRDRLAALALAVNLLVGLSSAPAGRAAVKSWSGASSGNWSLPANWTGNSAPVNGDQLVFPSTATRFTITNDVTNLKLDSITFDTGSGYDLRGNAITLTNGIAAQQTGSASDTIEFTITNAASQTYSCLNTGASLVVTGNLVLGSTTLTVTSALIGGITLGGVISGTGGVAKNGAGTLTYTGTAANTYGGPTLVNAGVLALGKSATPAIAGPLTIGDDIGGQAADVVRLLAAAQIGFGSAVTVNFSGLLDLNGFNNTIGSLTLLAGKVTTGTGTLGLLGPVTVGLDPTTNQNVSVISGGLTLSSAAQNFIISNSADCDVEAVVSGSGGLTKLGGGPLELSSSNTYSGPTLVGQGTLLVEHSFALGATNSGTVVSNGAQIKLRYNSHVGNEALTLNGAGPLGGGALASDIGTNSWAGPITLASNSVVSSAFSPSELILSNAISGPGSLSKIGDRPLVFAGANANTYTNYTSVQQGTLVLSKSVFDGAIQGSLYVGIDFGDPAEVRLTAPNQIANAATVYQFNTGLLNLNDNLERIGALEGSGPVSLGLGTLIVGDNGLSTFFLGLISGAGSFTKVGTGFLSLSGDNTYTGLTTVAGGTLRIDGKQSASPVTVGAGAVLGGGGAVGIITNIAGGSVAPVQGERFDAPTVIPSTLNCLGTVFAGASSSYAVELAGSNPGPSYNLFSTMGYDQLAVIGSNGLGGATLKVQAAFTLSNAPAIGDQFVIIANDGTDPIVGTFNGLPNRSSFTSNSLTFRINYDGGDGNDVVLTLTNVPGAAAGSIIASGNGNATVEPNECDLLQVIVSNRTASVMTGITGLLASATAGVTVLQSVSSYPDIPAFSRRTNTMPFQISTAPYLACSNNIQLELALQTVTHNSFAIPVVLPGTCALGSGACELCPDVSLSSALGTNTPTQSGRLNMTSNSICGIPKPCPGVFAGFTWRYDAFSFRNGPADACLIAILSAPAAAFGLSAAAYVGSYDPANQCTNYLADLGAFVNTDLPLAAFSFVVPSNSTFVVIVYQVANTGTTPYTLSVHGGDCRPALNISQAAADKVALDWTTAAAGYFLETTNQLAANTMPTATWLAVTNVPIVASGRFHVTNSIPATNQFFRLHKP